MAERSVPAVRYVSVEGPVTRTVPGTDEPLREITTRYLPPDKAPACIEFARAEPNFLARQIDLVGVPQLMSAERPTAPRLGGSRAISRPGRHHP